MEESDDDQKIVVFNEDDCSPGFIQTHALTRQQAKENFLPAQYSRSAIGNASDCRSRGQEFNPGVVLYLRRS